MQNSTILKRTIRGLFQTLNKRCQASSASGSVSGDGKQSSKKSGGFFRGFFEPRTIQLQDASHSQRLASKEGIIELQTHNVKSCSIDNYLKAHERLCQYFGDNYTSGLKLGCVSAGNFNVFVGSQDQFVHIWRFESGYHTLDAGNVALSNNKEYKLIRKDLLSTLASRGNQYLMTFR